MKKMKILVVALTCMAMMFCQVIGMGYVEAASKKTEIYHFFASGGGYETTKSYDIVGSSKKEKITIYAQAQNYTDIYKLTITINGYANIFNNYYGDKLYIYHIKLKNGKRFLLLNTATGNSTNYTLLYKCSSAGKLSVAKDFISDLPGLSKTSVSLSGNNFILKSSYVDFQEAVATTISFKATFKSTKYKTPATRTVTGIKTEDGVNKLYAAYKVQSYKAAGSKKKAVLIKAGQKVTLKSVTKKNYVFWYKVKVGKKTGYVKENPEYPPFTTAH